MNPAHVLMIGDNPAQLQAHMSILKYFWTIATADVHAYDHLLVTTDVVVLSHTLEEVERQRLVREISVARPEVLLVKINGYDSGPHAGVDASVDLHHGPAALISTLYELLTERGLGHRQWPETEYEFAHEESGRGVQ